MTGGGVKEGDDAVNLAGKYHHKRLIKDISWAYANFVCLESEKIQEQWLFYKDLHEMWSELPNYNPIGVSTSNAGQNFADQAAVLFWGCVDNDASSGVEDAEFNYNETTSHQHSEGPANIEDENDSSDEEWEESNISEEVIEPKTTEIIKPKPKKKPTAPKGKRPTTAAAATKDDKKAVIDSAAKKRPIDTFNDIQALELKDAAAHQEARNAICMKELELDLQRQQLEREKYKAKMRKMEIEAKKHKMSMQMMMRMMSAHTSAQSFIPQIEPLVKPLLSPQQFSWNNGSGQMNSIDGVLLPNPPSQE